MTDLSVLMLAYGEETYLHDAVAAVLASSGVEVELLLVDNGCTSDAVTTLPVDPRITILRPDHNLGFTGGVNLAARHARARSLALVNSDAIVAPDALEILVAGLAEPGVGIVSACIRLADRPDTVNSVGNPLHVLGLSWAGGLGEPVSDHDTPRAVSAASGACMAIRADLWNELGGLPEDFFAYAEDLELSWRTWQHGRSVRYLPTASARHHYEFSRSPLKMYLLERNRLLFVLTAYGPRMLALLALPLAAFELAILAVAARQGWARQKIRGWWWLITHAGRVRARRTLVQSTRTVPDRELVGLLTDTFDSAQMAMPSGAGAIQSALRLYWSLVSRWV